MNDNGAVTDAYAAVGVDTGEADRGVRALVDVLASIELGRASLTVPLPGHYASVLRIAPGLGIALTTDSVGSKVIVAEQAGRFDTIGIDCVAMNVNDLICVGAEPLALLDYLAVERVDPAQLREIAVGLRIGAQDAGVEIPGGEVCQLPEVIRGHPSPYGFDLVGSAFGTVALDRIVDGGTCAPGDVLIGLPASGVHSNGLTLARRALLEQGGLTLQ
jgi:phosphoribosylformylglycinamidine cyclo-ligase